MASLKWILVFVAVGYGAVIASMYLWQRALMYFPETARTEPVAAGLPEVSEASLKTSDGQTLIAWYRPPAADDKPIILYFHGNGGSLRMRADRFRKLMANGSGLLAVSWRGYGGSTGTPNEAGLKIDAQTAYAFAAERYPAERIVVFGESLGTAIAIAIAAEKPVAKLILDAPYTSAADIAASVYPFVPVRWLMKDQFRAAEQIGQVSVPVLMLHGEQDRVIPIAFAEKLYESITAPKSFVRFARGGHVDLDSHGAQDAIRNFLTR
jgi:fermentation-respiration switch protein FrsA (DUF1100 family)